MIIYGIGFEIDSSMSVIKNISELLITGTFKKEGLRKRGKTVYKRC